MKLKSYFVILISLVVGMLVIGLTSLIKTPEWLHSSFVILPVFIVVNLISAKILKLKNQLQDFWSLKKIYFLPIGFLVGGGIALSPLVIALAIGKIGLDELQLSSAFTLSSFFITLAVVSWEELWFRGIFLNHCKQNMSAIHISLIIGLLFMILHVLNPNINLLKTGPNLFLAGAFLTLVYFYFKTIWLPIGLHFGNNYLNFQSNLESHWLFGNEGYLSAIFLLGLFLLFAKLTLKKGKAVREIKG